MKIKEVWSFGTLGVPLIIAITLMTWAVRSGDYLLGWAAIIFGWQAGWGLKLTLESKKMMKDLE